MLLLFPLAFGCFRRSSLVQVSPTGTSFICRVKCDTPSDSPPHVENGCKQARRGNEKDSCDRRLGNDLSTPPAISQLTFFFIDLFNIFAHFERIRFTSGRKAGR